MKKIFLITGSIIFIAIFFGMILFLEELIRKELFTPTYQELEKQFAQKDIIRCIQSIDREVYHLSLMTRDWAQRNELYNFIEKYDHDFAASSLDMDNLSGLGIDLVFIISNKGQIIVEKIYDEESESEITLPATSAKLFSQTHTFKNLLQGDNHQASGIIVTGRGPLIIAASTILPSSGQGVPRGILIMGRFMSEKVVKELKEQTLVSFSVTVPDFSNYPEKELAGLRQEKGVFITSDDNTNLIGKAIFYDIYEKSSLLITATQSRDIYNQGLLFSKTSANIITFFFALFCIMGVSFFFFYRYKRNIQHEKTEALVIEKTQELTSLSSQLHALSEASTEGLMLLEDGYCIAMNKQTQKMFGYSQGEFDTHPTIELVIEEERERVKKLIAENIEGFYETIGLRKDLTTFPLLVHGKSVLYNNINLRAVALKDLTARRQAEVEKQILEDKLQRSQKMESIGILAGSVAHDLNNILSGVVTYPELVLMKLEKNSTCRQPLEAIIASGKQAAAVVADLLTLARGIALVMVPIDINQLISGYLNSAEFNVLATRYNNVKIQTHFTDNIPNVAGSVIHINKVIMNLITNSVEAISGHDNCTISISTTVVDILENSLKLEYGKYVVVDIADNGSGIPPADLDHIFEPFYSRKVKGRSGTGLGLTIVWNTLQDHKGTVTVKSDQHGTCFTLYFPVNEHELLITQDKIEINTIKGNNESILVVDDNKQQLDIANKILIALNYTVYLANSGEEALEFLERHKVDLVVLDMIMEPGISGYETYLKAIELYPGLRALIASGFSVSEEVEKAKKLGVSAFIRKPYSIAQIGSAIQTILAKN